MRCLIVLFMALAVARTGALSTLDFTYNVTAYPVLVSDIYYVPVITSVAPYNGVEDKCVNMETCTWYGHMHVCLHSHTHTQDRGLHSQVVPGPCPDCKTLQMKQHNPFFNFEADFGCRATVKYIEPPGIATLPSCTCTQGYRWRIACH